MVQRWLRFWGGIALSAVLLYVVFRDVDFVSLGQQLAALRWRYVGLGLFCMALVHALRVMRWGILVREFCTVGWGQIFRICSVGLMLVVVLPLRLGEFARPYLLRREIGAPVASGLAAVAVERTLDGLVVSLLFAAATVMLGRTHALPPSVLAGAAVAVTVFVGSAVVIVAALLTRDVVPQLIRRLGSPWLPRLTDKAVGLLEAFLLGLKSLPNLRGIAAFLCVTLLSWLLNGVVMFALFHAFGWELPWAAALLLVCVLVLGIMIPAGPGFLGTYQGAILVGLSIFGVSATDAAAFGAVAYPISIVIVVGFGLPFILYRRSDVSEVMHASAEAASATPAQCQR